MFDLEFHNTLDMSHAYRGTRKTQHSVLCLQSLQLSFAERSKNSGQVV